MKSQDALIDEINRELASEEMPFKACCICGEPFLPKRDTQVTCGSDKCKTAHKRNVTKEWYGRRGSGQKALMRQRDRERKRDRRTVERLVAEETFEAKKKLREDEEQRQRVRQFRERVERYQGNYGKAQAEDILKTVPKIETDK